MRRLLIQGVLVWAAVVVGGGVAGATWGLAGFDRDERLGRLEVDGPCPVSPDPTLPERASQAATGAIRLGLAALAIGYFPAAVFALSAGTLGWLLQHLGKTRAIRWAPWVALGIGAIACVVVLVSSELVTALWAWLGVIVSTVLTAIGIHQADHSEIVTGPPRPHQASENR